VVKQVNFEVTKYTGKVFEKTQQGKLYARVLVPGLRKGVRGPEGVVVKRTGGNRDSESGGNRTARCQRVQERIRKYHQVRLILVSGTKLTT